MISALHKSVRGSDDNAALYWLTRMMLGGEDPRYLARRLIRMASEDIGNCNYFLGFDDFHVQLSYIFLDFGKVSVTFA